MVLSVVSACQSLQSAASGAPSDHRRRRRPHASISIMHTTPPDRWPPLTPWSPTRLSSSPPVVVRPIGGRDRSIGGRRPVPAACRPGGCMRRTSIIVRPWYANTSDELKVLHYISSIIHEWHSDETRRENHAPCDDDRWAAGRAAVQCSAGHCEVVMHVCITGATGR